MPRLRFPRRRRHPYRTQTEPVPTTQGFLPGQLLVHHGPTGPQLALVDTVLTRVVELTFADGTSTVAVPDEVTPVPLADEIAGLVASLLRKHAWVLADNADMDQQMLSIRRYAIAKHREGYYCREELNDFLQTHSLLPYTPRYRARLLVTLDVDPAVGVDDSQLTDSTVVDEVRVVAGPSVTVTNLTVTAARLTEIDT